MFTSLNIFRMSAATASFAGGQQARIAQNIANADTPGFKAYQVTSFADAYRDAPKVRTGHIQLGQTDKRVTENASPNGNTVSLEEQMVHGVNVQKEHERALAIYRHGLSVLRTTLGR